MSPIAIFDPFSGIAGDMILGALVQCGLDREWLRALPGTLGLDDVGVRIDSVMRSGIACAKVEFDIPPQPHGRHLSTLLAIVQRAPAPPEVRSRAEEAFRAIASVEAEIHATTVERVHLHEVGAVDAILDIVGSIWGLKKLGVSAVYSGPVALGDGSVLTAHGLLPVPAPATLRLLEGLPSRSGPEGSGELTTPTGAALLKALGARPAPGRFIPLRSGYGAGTKDFPDRPNALRLVLAALDERSGGPGTEEVTLLAADIDDMSPEHLAAAAEELRFSGALDVVISPVVMKKGRSGTRLEVLCTPTVAHEMAELVLARTSTLGVRRVECIRHVLKRKEIVVELMGGSVRVKAAFPPGGAPRFKAELDDVIALARSLGTSASELATRAETEAGRILSATQEAVTNA